MKIKFIKHLIGGSNCSASLFQVDESRIVVKYCGNERLNEIFGSLIIEDYFDVKNRLEELNISVPETYAVFLSDRKLADLYIIESYMGVSLREHIKNKDKDVASLISLCRDFIKDLPEGLPLDVNPGNLVIDENNNVALVDFIPPDPWKYRGSKWQNLMEEIFPSTAGDYDYVNKMESYFKTEERLRRFDFHIDRIL